MSSQTLSTPQQVSCNHCRLTRTNCRLIHFNSDNDVIEETGDQHPPLCFSCTKKLVDPMRGLPGPLKCPHDGCGLRIEDPCNNDFTGFFLRELALNSDPISKMPKVNGGPTQSHSLAIESVKPKVDPAHNKKRKPTEDSTGENESDSFRSIKKRIIDVPKNRAPRRRRCQFINRYPHTCVQFLKVKRTRNGNYFCPDHFAFGELNNDAKIREQNAKVELKRVTQSLAAKRALKRAIVNEAKIAVAECKNEAIEDELGDDCDDSGDDSEEDPGDDCYDTSDDHEEVEEEADNSADKTN